MAETSKIQRFTDLVAWQIGHELVLEVYKHTRLFPKEELFGLTMQIRRAVVSVTSNIAEGFSRNSKKEKLQFYYISLGSLTEVQNQIIIAVDLHYISNKDFDGIVLLITRESKLINGFIKSLNT